MTSYTSGDYVPDLALVKYRLISKLKWQDLEADMVLVEYVRFLRMVASGRQSSLVPSLKVDEVWHAHILHTAMYAKDCQRIAGRFIHHHPEAPDAPKDGCAAYRATLALYADLFGAQPPSTVWPVVCGTGTRGGCSNDGCYGGCTTDACNSAADDGLLTTQ